MSISVLTKITYRVLITSWEVMTNPEKPVGETTETSQLQYQDTSPSTGNFAMPAMRRGDQGVQQAVWKWVKMAILDTNTDFEMFRHDMNFWPHDISSDSWRFRNVKSPNVPWCFLSFRIPRKMVSTGGIVCWLQTESTHRLPGYHGNSDVFTPPLSKISGFLVPHGQSSLRFRPPHS